MFKKVSLMTAYNERYLSIIKFKKMILSARYILSRKSKIGYNTSIYFWSEDTSRKNKRHSR